MNEDLWMNASAAFLATSNPTLKPLADMIRSDAPIPQSIRHMLADMMDPNAQPYLYFKLELRNTETERNNHLSDLEKLEIVTDFNRHRASGKTVEQAAAETGDKFGVDAKTVSRYRKRVDKIRAWLKGDN